MSAPNTRPSGSLLGKNSTVQTQSSSSCQYGSTSCCRFILSVSLNPQFPEFVAETRGASSCHSAWIPTLISAVAHYGLRYGSAPATGNLQRLRGRPPLVSPLKSCMGRSFTAVTRVQIPSGTPTKCRASANRLKRLCENYDCRVAVEWNSRFSAAKRRKNTAHGVSRGFKWKRNKPQRGERPVLTQSLKPAFLLALSGLAGILRLALVRVELLLDGRLGVPHLGVSRELGVAIFTDSEHGHVPEPFHDAKIAFGHGHSFPQGGADCQPAEIQVSYHIRNVPVLSTIEKPPSVRETRDADRNSGSRLFPLRFPAPARGSWRPGWSCRPW